MPSSDYSNAVGGGLKLKGAKDAGVKKKKKVKPTAGGEGSTSEAKPRDDTALQKALAEEEKGEGDMHMSRVREADVKEFGKTEAQRRFEERRRKRVCAARHIEYPGAAGLTCGSA